MSRRAVLAAPLLLVALTWYAYGGTAVVGASQDAHRQVDTIGSEGTVQDRSDFVISRSYEPGGSVVREHGAYIQFDLSSVSEIDDSGHSLTVYVVNGMTWSHGQLEVFALATNATYTPQDWTEDTLTFGSPQDEYDATLVDGVVDANRRYPDADFLGSFPARGADDPAAVTFSNAAFNAYVTNRFAAGGPITIIIANAPGANRAVYLDSREGGYPNTSHLNLSTPPVGPRVMEDLDRGVVAIRKGGSGVYVGWRMLGTEPESVGYNLHRDSTKINTSPITNSCNFLDPVGGTGSTYRVAAVVDGTEHPLSSPVGVWGDTFFDVALNRPAGGTTPDAVSYTYSPHDASVGDLDGDGQYEIVVKWRPSNWKDNSQSGYTGNVYLDAYEMDGTLLWRIDLGINIRAGSHYTQFMVYDLDCDGWAEVVCKTADGTTDGKGTVLGSASADYRNTSGYILSGPEYLSAFDGQTGAFIDTVDYVPPRGTVSDWGDSVGNRVDRFLGAVAYLDGRKPSVVMCRGQYTRVVLAAWDLVDRSLVQRWVFDSDDPGNSAYSGQGGHQLSVADADGDNRDEIVYGSCTIDHDGAGLYSTELGTGDALHVSDMDPSRPGLEVWMPHETAITGATYREAATGTIIWEQKDTRDIGRGVAAHIDANHPGYQMWSTVDGGVYHIDGTRISSNRNASMMGHVIWWDADLQREFLGSASRDGTRPIVDKWNGDGVTRLISLYNVPTDGATWNSSGTKATPCLSGDLFGDWREEIICPSSDNTRLRIFSSTEITTNRIYTLMHDPQYRLAIAWQNCSYNQPPHPSFYIGAGMTAPPKPDIILARAQRDAPQSTILWVR